MSGASPAMPSSRSRARSRVVSYPRKAEVARLTPELWPELALASWGHGIQRGLQKPGGTCGGASGLALQPEDLKSDETVGAGGRIVSALLASAAAGCRPLLDPPESESGTEKWCWSA